MVCVVNVKTANVHGHECETRQGNDVTHPPRDATESRKGIVTETETNIEEETIVETITLDATETSSVITAMILGVGEMTVNAMSA